MKRQSDIQTTPKKGLQSVLDTVIQVSRAGGNLGDIFEELILKAIQLNGIDAFRGLIGGGSFGDFLGDLFKFENGGVMTSRGSLPKRAYSRGGIATSPQLALYGEGRLPEAYVPLPDGKTIPVTLNMPDVPGINGKSTVSKTFIDASMNVSIDRPGASVEEIKASLLPDMQRQRQQILKDVAIQAENNPGYINT